MPRTKTKTTKVKYHSIIKLPPLSPDQYEGLRASIAVNGVLVPIMVDSDGPRRGIIDGTYRKQLADEFNYDCPEIVQQGLDAEEKRTLARALNLARRQLSTDQKRQLIADQLWETPERSSNWIGKMIGVDDKTVTSVRRELQSTSEFPKLDRTLGADGKYRAFPTQQPEVERYSPSWIVEGARRVMGAIDVDPASCKTANKVVKATKFFSQQTNGLRQHWRGRVFLNPPFGHEWRAWAEKLMQEIEAGRTRQAFLVAPGAVLWVLAAPWFRPLLRGSPPQRKSNGRERSSDQEPSPKSELHRQYPSSHSRTEPQEIKGYLNSRY